MCAEGRARSLLNLSPSGWRAELVTCGYAGYRGDQLARWVFRQRTFDFDRMSNLPAELRQRLGEGFSVEPPPIDQVFTSVDHSQRFLLAVGDGENVEAVSMPYPGRTTYCISSQVGCRFACTFCQTGRMQLARSLEVGEIVGQVLRLLSHGEQPAGRVNVVFMGQGEPLDNEDNVRAAVVALQDPLGLGLSWRRITVSTVGLVPAIERLAAMGEQRPSLAVSLNATTDATRDELMPINRKYPIAALTEALRAIVWRPRERMTFEYVLLDGINDTEQDARRLAGIVHGLPARVNLIPWNPLPTMAYRRPAAETIERFRRAARARGVDALVRYSRGGDIGAACGQLQSAALAG